MYQPGIPATVVTGEVEIEFVFFAPFNSDTTFAYHEVIYPCSLWTNAVFADTVYGLTPGQNQVGETVAKNIERATNGQVSIVAGTSRGGHYDIPGVFNPVDANGYLQAYVLPYTREELLSNGSLIGPAINAVLQAEGINNLPHDPHHVFVTIWMEDWASVPWNSPMWPHGSFGGGSVVSGAYFNDDMSMVGVLIHELGHSIFSLIDNYGPGNDQNSFNIMGNACYNNGGWLVPHYAAPDCAWHGWWPIIDIDNFADYGLYQLPLGSSLRIRNPFSNPRHPEWIYITHIGSEGVLQRSHNILTWWLKAEYVGIPDPYYPMNEVLVIVPPDSTASYDVAGDVLPWAGVAWWGEDVFVSSLNFPDWSQAVGVTGPIPNWAMIDSSYIAFDGEPGDSVATVQLGYHPTEPWFVLDDTSHIITVPVGCNQPWQLTVFNYGAAADLVTVEVASTDPLLPSFTMQAENVTEFSPIVFTSNPLGVTSDITAVGHMVPVTITFTGDAGVLNTQIDTILLSLPEASAWPDDNEWFELPAVYNGSGNLVVAAKTWNSIAAYRDKQFQWQRFVGDSVIAIAIKPDQQRIGVTTLSGVYQFDDLGNQVNYWPDPPTTSPFVGFVDLPDVNGNLWTYLWYISGQVMNFYDASGLPPDPQHDRQEVWLPLAPTGACYSLDHGQPRFGLTSGDQQTMSGSFIVVDEYGQVVFPESGIIPLESRLYYPPFAGDRNGDGYPNHYATYLAPSNIGGLANISYSVREDSTAAGWWQTAGHPLLDGCGFSSNPSYTSARLVHSHTVNSNGYEWRRYLSFDDNTLITLPRSEDFFFSSVNLDGSTVAVAALMVNRNEISFYGSDGGSLYPGNSKIVAKLGPDTLCGPPLSTYYAPADEWQLLTPARLGNLWRFRDYRTAAHAAGDWYGPNGNGANTRSHAWRGGPPECADDSTITLIITVVSGSPALDWVACFRQHITGYNVYTCSNLGDEWFLYDHVISHDYHGMLTITPSSEKQFFQVVATFSDVVGGIIDGSVYWGEQQP